MSPATLLRRVALAAGATAMLGLAACATPSNPAAMTLSATPGLTAAQGDVGYRSVTEVTVSGGRDTNPLWTAQVSNADFQTALRNSLAAAGYMGTEGRPMSVSATMIELQQPMMGLDLSVTSRVRYTVKQGDQVVFDETVAATGTASMRDAFAAVERLKLANEKSIQENIKQFLQRFRSST